MVSTNDEGVQYDKDSELVEQPLDTNIIMTKWVYALKFDGDSKISNKKTKIVVQEFLQI